jgi:hypothetical protein
LGGGPVFHWRIQMTYYKQMYDETKMHM